MEKRFDNVDERIRRYEKALNLRNEKLYLLENAYKHALPVRNKWLTKTKNIDKSTYWWDDTAKNGVQTFSSNLQSFLMNHQFFSIVAGRGIKHKDEVNRALEPITEALLDIFNTSNLNLEANIAFQDMAISVGLLKVHATGNRYNPITFHAIPLHCVALEDYNGKIESVWREMDVPARDIRSLWRDAQLSSKITSLLSSSPSTNVSLIEGTIYYPDNPPDSKYLYYVMEKETKNDIVFRNMPISEFIPFRFGVSPGEVWGSGPVINNLSTIRQLDKLKQFIIQNAGAKAAPLLMVENEHVFSEYNQLLSPGSIMRVNSVAQPPIATMDISGDLNAQNFSLDTMQADVRDALFADPLGPSGTKQTATEAQIRQQNWLRKSSSSISRLYAEFLYPLIQKTLHLLVAGGIEPFHRKIGNIPLKIDGYFLEVDFKSPLNLIEKERQAQNFQLAFQGMANTMGQLAPAALNLPEIPNFFADKFEVDLDLIKSPEEIQKQAQEIQSQIQQSQDEAQEGTPISVPKDTGQGAPEQQKLPPLDLLGG